MNRSRETSWKYGTRFSLMNDEKELCIIWKWERICFDCVAKVDVEVRIVLGVPGVS